MLFASTAALSAALPLAVLFSRACFSCSISLFRSFTCFLRTRAAFFSFPTNPACSFALSTSRDALAAASSILFCMADSVSTHARLLLSDAFRRRCSWDLSVPISTLASDNCCSRSSARDASASEGDDEEATTATLVSRSFFSCKMS